MQVSDKMIDRAVNLWAKKLCAPFFDNGDTSPNAPLIAGLAAMNIESAKDRTGDIVPKLSMFKEHLSKSLKEARDSGEYFPSWLDVDYGPCKELAEAATAADIDHTLFSCKSTVSINEGYISTSFGYGAPYIYHRPLDNGNWLISDLTGGADFEKVLALCNDGKNPLGLTIEE